jgi:hypothetical protein
VAARTQEFQTIRSEGGLLPPDLLRRVLDPKLKLEGTAPQDYGLPPTERLNEAITQSWNRLRKHWVEFRGAAKRLPKGDAGTGITNDKWSVPLLRELSFGMLPASAAPEIDGKTYAINRFFGATAIHLVGCGLSLDRRAVGVRGAATANPHGLVQDFLNRSGAHLWAILSNGLRFRILRDSQAISRQSYLEFDLEAMFDGEVFSDFVLLWLMAHATRFAVHEDDRPETCWLEQWTKLAEEQGVSALKALGKQVEKALQILGEGLVGNPKNTALKDALRTGRLSPVDLHGQLLRVVYRLIFLFVAEDRTLEGLPLLHAPNASDSGRIARERYAAHYSVGRLREMAGSIRGSRHGDLWWQLNLVVGALSGDDRFIAMREQLALPVLGSFLWSLESTAALNAPSLAATGGTELANADLLEAIRNLAFSRQHHSSRPVDYKNLGAEELGGVYESLLALTPQVSGDGAKFTFAEFAGNERKISGSYYTPDSLVQCLLDSALDPVVEKVIKDKRGFDAEKAILALKVCDPAVGSGHFLVGAAHRLARHLARIRAVAQGEGEPSPSFYQHALRDVIGRCLYGVDINPMAAELCRLSLWLEALDPGKPLSFLDHHIRVGNSLLGATPELIAGGLPDEAFEALEGDDPAACAALKRRNRMERGESGEGAQRDMLHGAVSRLGEELATISGVSQRLDTTADDSIGALQKKAEQFRRLIVSDEFKHAQRVADAWCSAFVWKKSGDDAAHAITTDAIRQLEANPTSLTPDQVREMDRLSARYQFFHWHLAFPEVIAKGGFDVVFGNPPWDTLSPDAKEFFSSYDPAVRNVDKESQQKRINELLESPEIAARWKQSRREIFGGVHFIKRSGRYRLFAEGNLGKGDFNIYRMFVETAFSRALNGGICAQFVPEGIYNGANCAAIRTALFEENTLHAIVGFENSREIWFKDIDSRMKFAMYVATVGGRTDRFNAVFNVRRLDQLEKLRRGEGLIVPVTVVREFSPDALAVMEFSDQRDIDIATKMYAPWPKFGDTGAGPPLRVYMREIDMGTDRDIFGDWQDGMPLYEGRMIDQFDHRAKAYESGRGRSAVWLSIAFGDPRKSIRPQWRVPPGNVPEKVRSRMSGYRLGFCDITSPTNERSLVAALIPVNVLCGHSVPTIVFGDGEDWFYPVWLAIANSFAMDWVVRQKVQLHMTYTVMDTLPFPRLARNHRLVGELGKLVLQLICCGSEMVPFWNARAAEGCVVPVPADGPSPGIEDASERLKLRARIDAIVGRDVFGLSSDEMTYVLDTFPIWREREQVEFGEFRTRRLILEHMKESGSPS